MSIKSLFRSFAGGEITPELTGRVDLAKFQTGVSVARNFTVLPHGPLARRPGFGFINEAKDSTQAVRLIPFVFSASQTAVLEFGHQYIRFHINGGTLIEATKAISSIAGSTVNTSVAHGYSTGDWVYIGTRYHKVTVVDADTFTTTDLWGVATTASGTTAARVYTLASTYTAADLFALNYTQSSDVITITHPSYPARELKRLGETNWTLTDISFAPTVTAPGVPTLTLDTSAGTSNGETYYYCVTSVKDDGVTESLASPIASAYNNLTKTGNKITISWTAVPGINRYNVYKRRGGLYGYLGQSDGTPVVDDNILPDTTQTPPEDIIALNSGANDYPTATTYYEQRRWFAGTNDKPQVVWATRTGTESNLTSSLPARDADGLELRVASMQNNKILHLAPLSDLIALTAGGEFRLFADGAPAITPTSVSIKPQGYSGANNVQPVVTSGSVIYVQAQGSHIRELAYGGESANYGYRSINISIMAPHRFNGYTITQLAHTRAPDPTIWAVRSDGAMLGMTYVPEQQVSAWHFHDTDGAIESACAVAESNEDVLYLVVKRNVDGRDVRYIERLRSRLFVQPEDAFFVDSGLTYDGAPTTTITGLWHLEGKEVDILADAAVHPRATVTNGSITLASPASVVHVGLPIVADFATLPLSLEGAQASGQGTVKNVNKVHMRLSESLVAKAGPSFLQLRANSFSRQVTDPYGSAPALRNGELSITIDPSWNQDARVCVRQDLPLPLTVLSMTLEVTTGG